VSDHPQPYRVSAAFRYAAAVFGKHFAPLVILTVVLLLAVTALQYVGNLVTLAVIPDRTYNLATGEYEGGAGGFFGVATTVSFLFVALSIAAGMVVQAGIVRASLALSRGLPVDVRSAFRGMRWGPVLLASLLVATLAFIGLLLCVLPGIAVLFLLSYSLFFVTDRDEDAVRALRSSVRMVASDPGPLSLFFLTSVVVLVLGACLCGLGLLAALPVVVIAQAYTFRTLNNDPVTA
jgi:hypothetical protein